MVEPNEHGIIRPPWRRKQGAMVGAQRSGQMAGMTTGAMAVRLAPVLAILALMGCVIQGGTSATYDPTKDARIRACRGPLAYFRFNRGCRPPESLPGRYPHPIVAPSRVCRALLTRQSACRCRTTLREYVVLADKPITIRCAPDTRTCAKRIPFRFPTRWCQGPLLRR